MAGSLYGASDTGLSHAATLKVSSSFFKLLGSKAKQIADEESQKMANSMEYILRHRQTFKIVGGQFPRWDPTYNGKYPNRRLPKSNRSFDMWRVKPYKDGTYWLVNTQRPEGTFNYVSALLNGGPWRTTKPITERLRPYNGGLYSYQMPQGLDPWKKVKRKELSTNVVERIRKEL